MYIFNLAQTIAISIGNAFDPMDFDARSFTPCAQNKFRQGERRNTWFTALVTGRYSHSVFEQQWYLGPM